MGDLAKRTATMPVEHARLEHSELFTFFAVAAVVALIIGVGMAVYMGLRDYRRKRERRDARKALRHSGKRRSSGS